MQFFPALKNKRLVEIWLYMVSYNQKGNKQWDLVSKKQTNKKTSATIIDSKSA